MVKSFHSEKLVPEKFNAIIMPGKFETGHAYTGNWIAQFCLCILEGEDYCAMESS
jgi:hypothetical protein